MLLLHVSGYGASARPPSNPSINLASGGRIVNPIQGSEKLEGDGFPLLFL